MAEFPEGGLRSFNIEDVRGTRCRLQRLSDLKFISGWVRDVGPDQLKIELKDRIVVEPGDRFNVEASIELATVGLPCQATDVKAELITLAVTGEPLVTTPGQEARYQAEDITVIVHGSERSFEGDAVDISANGIGVLVDDQMERFAKTRLSVRGTGAVVECVGIVRYCRPDSVYKDSYRVGFEIQFEDRLSRAMWLRLVQGASQTKMKAA